MKIHTKHFDATTFGMTAKSSSQSKRNLKSAFSIKKCNQKSIVEKEKK